MPWLNDLYKTNPFAMFLVVLLGAGGTGTGLTVLHSAKAMATESYVDAKVARVREELEAGFRAIKITIRCDRAASEVTRLETEEFRLVQDSRLDPNNAYLLDRIDKVSNAISDHKVVVLSRECH